MMVTAFFTLNLMRLNAVLVSLVYYNKAHINNITALEIEGQHTAHNAH
jgi:hypothetical protein